MVFIDQEWSREFFGKKIYSFSKYNTDIFVDINFFVLFNDLLINLVGQLDV